MELASYNLTPSCERHIYIYICVCVCVCVCPAVSPLNSWTATKVAGGFNSSVKVLINKILQALDNKNKVGVYSLIKESFWLFKPYNFVIKITILWNNRKYV